MRKMTGREKKRAFSCKLSVLAQKILWDQNSENQEYIKIVVSAEIVQNLK